MTTGHKFNKLFFIFSSIKNTLKKETHIRKELAKQQKHLAILNSAEQIMLRDGLNGLSMDKVAKEAKIAKGTLYLYFKSKEDIIAQLTIKARQELLRVFHQYAEKHENSLDKIEGIFWANYYFYEENKLYTSLVAFYEVNQHLEETEDLKMSSLNISSYVLSILEKAKREKLIKPTVDTTMFTMNMWGATVGMIQFLHTKSDHIKTHLNKPQKVLFKHFVKILIDGIKA